MKILRLDLRAFGPFTNVVLPLDAGNHGLHVIHGPNEAGKSTALRAVEQLFFGIPKQTGDDFLHPYKSLRIGATLRNSQGDALEFWRRKSDKNSLLMADEKTPLAPGELARFLGKIDQDMFAKMFGLNRKTLQDGGEEIRLGRGQFGQMLFSAGSGVADLRGVQQQLHEDYEKLFLPTGRNPLINARLGEWRLERERAKHLQLSLDTWLQQDQVLSEARARRQTLQDQLAKLDREITQLRRKGDAQPALLRRSELLRELTPYREAVLLPDDFPKRRSDAQIELRWAEDQEAAARQEIARIDQELSLLNVPLDLLAHADVIEALFQEKGSIDKAARDRGQNLRSQLNHEHRAREIWKSLGRTEEMLSHVESLRLRPDEPETIRQHGNQRAVILTTLDNAGKRIDELQRQLAECRDALSRLPASRDVSELRRVVAQIQKLGPLEENLHQAELQLTRQQAQAEQLRKRLRLQQESTEGVLALPVPTLETVERFHQQFHQVQQRLDLLYKNRETLDADLDRLKIDLRQLETQHAVPTEDELKSARRKRDEQWRIIRTAWKEGDTIPTRVLQQYQTADLTELYEHSVKNADALADRLRHEAELVARHAEMLFQQDRQGTLKARLLSQLAEVEALREVIQQDWRQLWLPLGVEPLLPNEMRTRVDQLNELIRLLQQGQSQQGECVAQRKRIEALTGQLRELLSDRRGEGLTLAELVDLGLAALAENDQHARSQQAWDEKFASTTRDLAEAQRVQEKSAQALTDWQAEWSRHMERIGLPTTTLPVSASKCLEEIADLWNEVREAKGFFSRNKGIDKDKEDFDRRISELQRRLLPDFTMDPAAAVVELHQRLRQARADQQQADDLARERKKWQTEAQQVQANLRKQKALLESLCQEAGAGSIAELPALEARSQKRRALERELHQKESELLPLRAGLSFEDFALAVGQIDPDRLEFQLAEWTREKSQIQEALNKVNENIGSVQNELDRMDGSAAAAEAAQRVEELAAQLQDDVQQYMVLRLASGILQRGIEQHRRQNEGPVLQRAAVLFASLTGGSFASLELDQGESGETILVGVRARDRTPLGVEAMSDGSRDQLYLALRLASLEVFLDHHESIPFIVDDLLPNFDDDRAVAALRALGELSRRTQVLFFTHHRHLVELAQRHLPAEVVFVHELQNATAK